MVALPEIVAACVALLVAAAEWRHSRRTRRMASLAFGPALAPRRWTRSAPALRTVATAAAAWGLATLFFAEPAVYRAKQAEPNHQRHVVIVLDVSPSMKLDDAGAGGETRRSKRAAELLRSFFERVPMEVVRLSVIATYTSAKPVVVDTTDVAVVENILDDLPLAHAFESGQTDLFSGIAEAARIARPWERDSTTILVLSDGDSVPPTGMPEMPPSVKTVVLVGVGDTRTGKFIDGRQSRQEAAALQQIAVRLNGAYYDGNRNHLPTNLLRRITVLPEPGLFVKLTRREYALAALAASAVALAALPWALLAFGTAWRPGVRTPAPRQSPHRISPPRIPPNRSRQSPAPSSRI